MGENRIMDNLKESIKVYKGLKVIGHKLGGTTTLDVFFNIEDDEEPEEHSEQQATPDVDEEESEEFEDLSEFEEEIEAEERRSTILVHQLPHGTTRGPPQLPR
jgi:hypothetical protein